MEEQFAAIDGRPGLLLHSCCAPCSSSVLERLEDRFSVSVFYYNPNIYPESEYRRRAEEQRLFLEKRGGIPLIETPFTPADFEPLAKQYGDLPERGERCRACYRLRIRKAARYAAEHGFLWLCSTLSLSPHKNADWVNEEGEAAARDAGINWLFSDFKKKDGFLRSLTLSAEYGLYRQEWCGCVFSYRARFGADFANEE